MEVGLSFERSDRIFAGHARRAIDQRCLEKRRAGTLPSLELLIILPNQRGASGRIRSGHTGSAHERVARVVRIGAPELEERRLAGTRRRDVGTGSNDIRLNPGVVGRSSGAERREALDIARHLLFADGGHRIAISPGIRPGHCRIAALGTVVAARSDRQRVLRIRGIGHAWPIDKSGRSARFGSFHAGYRHAVIASGNDDQHVGMSEHIAVDIARCRRILREAIGSPAVVVDAYAILVGLVEQLTEIRRQAAQHAISVEDRLEEKLGLGRRTSHFAVRRAAVACGAACNMGTMSLWIAVIPGAAPGEDAHDAATEVRMPVIQSRVSNANDLPFALQSEGRIAWLLEPKNLACHPIERMWKRYLLDCCDLRQLGKVSQVIAVLNQRDLQRIGMRTNWLTPTRLQPFDHLLQVLRAVSAHGKRACEPLRTRAARDGPSCPSRQRVRFVVKTDCVEEGLGLEPSDLVRRQARRITVVVQSLQEFDIIFFERAASARGKRSGEPHHVELSIGRVP